MQNKHFGALIVSHGRPDRMLTIKTLKDRGFTGTIKILIDDEDDQADQYYKLFPDMVVTFSKKEYDGKFDKADNRPDRGSVIWARNATFDIAKSLGWKTFVVLDDDYSDFGYRINHKNEFGDWKIKSLDAVFDAMLEYYLSTPALTISMAQSGDFIGGKNSGMAKVLTPKRKAMQTFFCATDRPFLWYGRMNDDVNTYCVHGSRGELIMQIPQVAIHQPQTQQHGGGLTEMYLESGTYVKSFYSVMFNPSSVKVSTLGESHQRLHHRIQWNNTVSKILSPDLKKNKR